MIRISPKKLTKSTPYIVAALIGAAIVGIGDVFDVWVKVESYFEDKEVIKILEPSTIDKVAIERLRAIEQKKHIVYSELDTPSHSSVEKYFLFANSDFIQTLNRPKTQQYDDSSRLFFVMAEAGAGKSFIARQIESTKSVLIHKIKLSDIASRSNLNRNLFVLQPDLENNNSQYKYILSALPNIKSGEKFDLNKLYSLASIEITQNKNNVVIIDDIDEMHPNFAKIILELIASEIRNLNNGRFAGTFVDFIVLGRPEGFRKYFINPRRKPVNINFYELRPPVFKSRGDLTVLINNYNAYFPGSEVNVDAVILKIEDMLANNPFILPTLGNLAQSNFWIQELSKEDTKSGEDLKEKMLSALLTRNQNSHGRPAKDDDLYRLVLSEIAKKYATKVDVNGYFEVGGHDKVMATYKTSTKKELVSLNVVDVLNRSGVTYLKPSSFLNPKYQFRPIWLHGYLATH